MFIEPFGPLRRSTIVSALAVAGFAFATTAPAEVYDTVEVRGAQFIPEDDIRMTCGAEAGVDYVYLELRAIEDCLMSTGVFESVTLLAVDRTLIIDVQEADTRPGRVDVSLGYASQDGLLASLAFERYNLFDRTYGALTLDYGPVIQTVTANLYRTEAFESAFDLGGEIVAGRSAYDSLDYIHDSLRAEVYLAWPVTAETRFEGGLGFRDHRLSEVDADASPLLHAEETNGIAAPYLRFSLSHVQSGDDLTDVGYALRLDQFLWNVGTEDLLMDSRVEARIRWPLTPRLRLLSGIDAGSIMSLADNSSRAIDRFFPGAEGFRGFAPRGIGPRDSGGALGGNTFFRTSVELQRDLGNVFNIPMQAGAFIDAGSSWRLDDTLGGAIDDDWHLRSTIGASLSFEIGGTPASIYLATPMLQRDGDKTQLIGLSLQNSF